jgi:hypothetical protein
VSVTVIGGGGVVGVLKASFLSNSRVVNNTRVSGATEACPTDIFVRNLL